jgi:cytohesin
MKHLLLTTIVAVVLVGCGKPSIHHAAKGGNIEAVKQHLNDGADIELKCVNCGGTVLGHAAFGGQKEIAKLLIAKGADVNTKNKNSTTPLRWAALKGSKEIAELLITNGANVNAKNDRGGTPLHSAALKGHKEIAELLIAKGANVNAKLVSGPKQGLTPLDAANETNQTEIAALLRKHGGKTGEELPNPPNIPLWKAIQSGNIDAVKQHLDAGTDVNWDASSGWTQLTWAAHENRTKIGKLLIEYGAGVNEHGRTVGHTALHEACRNGHKEFVELLIANDVDVNLKRKFGSTPLAWAENREITELLLANGADVNARNNDGFTPLDSAIQQKKTEIADLLRKHVGKTGAELKAEGK